MTESVKYAVLMYIWYTGQSVFGNCTLDRNDHNKYPYLLRLVVDKQVRCIGALITPNYFISAYKPVKEMVDDNKLLTKLYVKGQMFGKKSKMLCTATRQAYKAVWVGNGRNLFTGHIKYGFEVTENNPYLVKNMNEYNNFFYNRKFSKLTDFDCCTLPVFDSKTKENPALVEDSVTFVKGPTADYWMNVSCKSKEFQKCDLKTSSYFFAYDPNEEEREEDFDWYQGTPIVCHGTPLGLLSMMIEDNSTSMKVSVFEHIKTFSGQYNKKAQKEWPQVNGATRSLYYLPANIFATCAIILAHRAE